MQPLWLTKLFGEMFFMPCSTVYSAYVLRICTDAESYSANATSIDVVCDYGGGNPVTWDYTLAAEVWNDPYWQAKKLLTGYFSHSTPAKIFYINELGLSPGDNSVRIKGYFTRRDNGSTTTEQTPAFIVKR